MGDDEGETATEDNKESPKDGAGQSEEKSDKAGKKGKKEKKTWEEKLAEENKKKRDEAMPWGSDPCVKVRLKLGKLPHKEIFAIKGSSFPWYEPTMKAYDLWKQGELELDDEAIKKKKKEDKDQLEAIMAKNLEKIQKLSEEVHKRRVFDSNRKPGDTETFEQYCARKERIEKKKQKRKKEEEELKMLEEEEEEEDGKAKKPKKKKDKDKKDKKKKDKQKDEDKKKKKEKPKKSETESDGEEEEEEGEGEVEKVEEGEEEGEDEAREDEKVDEAKDKKKKEKDEKTESGEKSEEGEDKKQKEKKKKKKYDEKKDWPGSYVTNVTEDFITMLKMIIEAECDTKPAESKKKKPPPKPTKKDKILKEFTSFLNVLFTANEMMKKKEEEEEGKGDKKSDIKRRSSSDKRANGDEKELKATNLSPAEDEANNRDVEVLEETEEGTEEAGDLEA